MLTYKKPIRVSTEPSGYVYFIDPSHPLATGAAGRVYYHRHLASLREGRWIDTHEHVHHKDHDPRNNALDNLLLLTSSEHSRLHALERSNVEEQKCPSCGKMFRPPHSKEARMHFSCSKACENKRRRKFDPPKEELEKLVWELPATHIAKFYGVSDRAVIKRCKKLGIKKPGPGYWMKKRKAERASMA